MRHQIAMGMFFFDRIFFNWLIIYDFFSFERKKVLKIVFSQIFGRRKFRIFFFKKHFFSGIIFQKTFFSGFFFKKHFFRNFFFDKKTFFFEFSFSAKKISGFFSNKIFFNNIFFRVFSKILFSKNWSKFLSHRFFYDFFLSNFQKKKC